MKKSLRDRGVNMDADVLTFARWARMQGEGPAHILKRLTQAAESGTLIHYGRKQASVLDMHGREIPLIHTLQRATKAYAPPAPTDQWTLAGTYENENWTPREAGRVAQVIAEVLEPTWGLHRGLSNREAARCAWICTMFVDIPNWLAFSLSVDYEARLDRRATTGDLDGLLAFTPWRAGQAAQYQQALVEEWVPRLPPSAMTVLFTGPHPFAPVDPSDVVEELDIPAPDEEDYLG